MVNKKNTSYGFPISGERDIFLVAPNDLTERDFKRIHEWIDSLKYGLLCVKLPISTDNKVEGG